jgi:fluoroacetyl-CoA thioesterase
MTSPDTNFGAIQPGLEGQVRLVVSAEHTAQHLGSGAVQVLATPQMVLLMERASVAAVDPLLPEGYRTVGAHLDVQHLAKTQDEAEVVGDGTHQRVIINVQRFSERIAQKRIKT